MVKSKPVFTVFYSSDTLSWSMILNSNEWGFCEALIPCKPTTRQVRKFKKDAYKALM